MNKTLKIFPIIAMMLTHVIVIQWYYKLELLRSNANTVLYSYVFIISIGYLVAYYYIYKDEPVGYILMWLICFSLYYVYNKNIGISFKSLYSSLDVWINLIITLSPFIKRKENNLQYNK